MAEPTYHEENHSERWVFVWVLAIELIWAVVLAWRTFWNGMMVPAFDWFRNDVFWRVIEKTRLILRRR